MARLSDPEREDIVQRLACYRQPSVVAAWATREFNKDISRQQVEHYDPTRNDNIAEKWVEVFQETREEYLQNERRVAIAQKMWRLRQLQQIANDDEQDAETRMGALEQAAKETGGKYTNTQHLEHTGGGGGALQINVVNEPSDAGD